MTTKHPEILLVPSDQGQIACNGGGVLGHPKVYYTFHGQDDVVCGYCDRLFTKKQQPGSKNYRDVV